MIKSLLPDAKFFAECPIQQDRLLTANLLEGDVPHIVRSLYHQLSVIRSAQSGKGVHGIMIGSYGDRKEFTWYVRDFFCG